jgi:hypothetical protein
LNVQGEVQFVRRFPQEHRLLVPVAVPGRETSVAIDLSHRTAEIKRRNTGIWEATVQLHKAPGPHLTAIRMNWFMIRVWRWASDSTAYLLFFISVSGIYLWVALRAERRAGMFLLAAGSCWFFGMIYALSH